VRGLADARDSRVKANVGGRLTKAKRAGEVRGTRGRGRYIVEEDLAPRGDLAEGGVGQRWYLGLWVWGLRSG
jgi:hypothetical protein